LTTELLLNLSTERLIRPLCWLQPRILLGAIMQQPLGRTDGWCNLAIRDTAHPVMPHVICSATLRQASGGQYWIPGAVNTRHSLASIIRLLCATAYAQLQDEIEHGPPPRPPSPMQHKMTRWSQQRGNDEDDLECPPSAITVAQTRRNLIIAATSALDAIKRLPANVLPTCENAYSFLPCKQLPGGWFLLPSPGKPARTARAKAQLSIPTSEDFLRMPGLNPDVS
jgi:hypothetical protein